MPTSNEPIVNSPPTSETPANDPRVYLAAERTFLAWIRTGMALMGFGFVLARFGVFLRQIELTRGDSPPRFAISAWCGAALMLVGVVLNTVAIRHHLRLIRSLNEGRVELNKPSRIAIGVAAVLACIGLVVVLDLVILN
jgi:putative membrane protein